MYTRRKEVIKHFGERIEQSILYLQTRQGQTLAHLAAQLESLSPLAVLSRGYTLARDEQGRVVTSAADLTVGRELELRFADGTARAAVKNVMLFESENNT